MPTRAEYKAMGYTDKQINDAIMQKKLTIDGGTGLAGYVKPVPVKPAVDGSQGPITQKNVPKNTGIIPPITSAPVTQAPLKGNFGDVASDNVHAPGFEATGVAYQERAQKTADELAKISTAEGAAKQAAINKKNEGALGKSQAQETELQRIAKEYGTNVEKSRADAEKIFQRQDQIAGRQANMAAAQAGESGLTMSQGAVQDIKDDVIAKYGSNIANAEQFKAQTNMSLNDALKNTGLAIFDKQANIDLFQKSLTDEAFAPVLNAMTEAAKGNKDAINDVDKYYKGFIQQKANEEYLRTQASEGRTARDKEWYAPGMNAAKRISLLQSYAKAEGTPISNLDAAYGLMLSYPDYNQAQIIAKLAKIEDLKKEGGTAYLTYLEKRAAGGALDPKWEEYGNKLAPDATRSLDQTDLNVEQTKEAAKTIDKKLELDRKRGEEINKNVMDGYKNEKEKFETIDTYRDAFNYYTKPESEKVYLDKIWGKLKDEWKVGQPKQNTSVAPVISRSEQEKQDTKTYTYKGKPYTFAQVKDAMKKGTPAQRNQMNKEFGLNYDTSTGLPRS